VGNIFLSQFESLFEKGKFSRFSLVNTLSSDTEETVWKERPVRLVKNQFSAIPIISSIRIQQFCKQKLKMVLQYAQEEIEKYSPEIIWGVLNSVNQIFFIDALMQRVDLPFVITIWDSPELLIQRLRLDTWTAQNVLFTFYKILNKAKHVTVICDGMGKYFEKNGTATPYSVIHTGILEESKVSIRKQKPKSDVLHIAFTGSIYSKLEWNAFVQAIEYWNKTHQQKIEFHVAGSLPKFGIYFPKFIDYRGILSPNEANLLLQRADIAYLPYWFDKKKEMVVKTSFPSKLSAYIAMGIPVFFHGPHYASVCQVMKKYRIGISCHSLDVKNIIATLKQLLDDNLFYDNYYIERKNVFDEELSSIVMINRYKDIINRILNT
jgi:glycosyltransferase involved in cell wall biosynthesis